MPFLDFLDFDRLRRGILYAAYMIIVLALQNLVFSRIELLGVRPMFVPAAAVAVGMCAGGAAGGAFGLFLGFLCDMSYSENAVMFTILFPAFGFLAGFVTEFFINRRFFAYFFVSAAAFLITAFCQLFGLWIFAGADAGALFRTAGLQSLWSVPFIFLLYAPAKAIAQKRWN